MHSYVGPDAEYRDNNLTPADSDRAMEEGVLNNPAVGGPSSAEQASDREEHILDQPEEVVVSKGKMRKSSRSSLAVEA